jgi:2,5-dihydroxypyridine 5,6-dioxygenase
MNNSSNKTFEPDLIQGVNIIALELGNLQFDESVLIITDHETEFLGEIFEKILIVKKYSINHISIQPLKSHGESLPEHISKLMNSSDLIIGLTKSSMAHSKERIMSEKYGSRYLSLPDYSEFILKHPSLRVNFKEIAKNAIHLSEKLSKADKITIKTESGTDLELTVSGRNGNFAPGYVNSDIKLGSPPDIECNIAPIEDKSNGKIVVDGSIPHPELGLLNSKITLNIYNGKIKNISGDKITVGKISKILNLKDHPIFLGEFGIGLNNKAELTGNMLLDEGCMGTIHFGFGSNVALGGKIREDYHLDFILNSKECLFDNEKIEFKKFGDYP